MEAVLAEITDPAAKTAKAEDFLDMRFVAELDKERRQVSRAMSEFVTIFLSEPRAFALARIGNLNCRPRPSGAKPAHHSGR